MQRKMDGDSLLSEEQRRGVVSGFLESDTLHLIATDIGNFQKEIMCLDPQYCSCENRGIEVYTFPSLPPIVHQQNPIGIESIPTKI